MAAAVGKFAARKMLSSQLKQYKDKEPAGQYVRTIYRHATSNHSN